MNIMKAACVLMIVFMSLASCYSQQHKLRGDSLLHFKIGSTIRYPSSLRSNKENAIVLVLINFQSDKIYKTTFLNNNIDTSIINTINENLNKVDFDKIGNQITPLLLTYIFIDIDEYENKQTLNISKKSMDFDFGKKILLENCRILAPIYSYNPSSKRIND